MVKKLLNYLENGILQASTKRNKQLFVYAYLILDHLVKRDKILMFYIRLLQNTFIIINLYYTGLKVPRTTG